MGKMIDPPLDVVMGYYMKKVIEKDNTDDEWLSHFLKIQHEPYDVLDIDDVYCVNPSSHFKTRDPRILHEGRYVSAIVLGFDTSKTGGCESGCWRIMARDKLIKCETRGETIGFKRVLKFCETKKKRVKDERVWVMEEYRHASKKKQYCVLCRIRLLNPEPLHFLLSNHLRGYYTNL